MASKLKSPNPSEAQRGGGSTTARKSASASTVSSRATAQAAAAAAKSKHFIIGGAASQSSPFKSFVTTGLRTRRSGLKGSPEGFSYDLSRDEILYINTLQSPMKLVPDEQRALLRDGQRSAYLTRRNEEAPSHKYNYPEATSWRHGWLLQRQRTTA